MDKLTLSAVGIGEPLHHSIADQQQAADEKVGETSRVPAQEDGTYVNKEDTLRGTDQHRAAADEKVDISTRMKLHQLDSSTDLKELDEYFMALEEDRRNLQDLLQEQKQEHEMELKAIERERLQERLEWEVKMQEREEALRSALISMAISKDKMKKDLMTRLAVCTSTAPASEVKNNVLQETAELEERVRSTAMGKQQKALLKAQSAEKKRRQKALQKAKREARKAEKAGGKNRGEKPEVESDSSSQPGCSTQSDTMATEQDRKDNKKTVGCFGFLFRRRKATQGSKTVGEQ